MKRILPIILAILLLPTVCFGQHTGVYTINDFSKMLQSQVSPYLLPKNAASVAENVRANDIYGSLAKRPPMKTYGSVGAFKITSLHRFYQADDTAKLLATGSTLILVGDDDAGTFTTIRDQLTSGLRWSWVTYKDKAIGCNGTDNCQKYDNKTTTTANTDGARSASVLTSDLGAPFAELNTGANLDASKWYQYKMQFYDGTTNYYSTAVSNPILTGSSVQDITLTDIPLGPSGTTHRYIYRTEGQTARADLSSATFKLAITIADNTTITTNDAVADGSLTTTWDISGKTSLTPPIVKYIVLHKERLFGGNKPSFNSYIYWSVAFKPDIFHSSDSDYVRVDDGDEITFIKEILGKLAIGKTNTITNFETQSTSDVNWRFYTYSFTGCPAPYSAVNSPIGIIYLGWDGIYVYNGESSQLVSDSVTKEIRDILPANIGEVVGLYFQNEYQMSYTSADSGESINNRVLILDRVRNAYVIDYKNINAFEVFDSGLDFGTLYSGSSTTDGNVLSHNPSISTFTIKYKSEIDQGTKDSLVVAGTESMPEMELGWGITINDTSLAGIKINDVSLAGSTINRKSTTGYWWSQALQVNASDYDKLYWNESLGGTGDITFAIRSAASAAAVIVDGLAWSSEFTDPSGADVSGETANDYLQIRSTFTTTDITQTPSISSLNNFVIKLIYSKVGTVAETSIPSLWKSGFTTLSQETTPKRIHGIDIYYRGTSGTLTFRFVNSEGDIDDSFDIDLSVNPTSSDEDLYYGDAINKVHIWDAVLNSEEDPTPIGEKWMFSITETGVVTWNVYKINVRFSEDEYHYYNN